MFFKKPKPIRFESLRSALATITDPLSGRDLVSAGAIKQLQFKDGTVRFEVASHATGPHADDLRRRCEEAVRTVEGVQTVEVTVARPAGAPAAAAPKPAAPKPPGAPGRIQLPRIQKVIAVASGKGGVGKSTVAVNLAVSLAQAGHKVGLLDADVYGPSLPVMMGVKDRPEPSGESRIQPLEKYGIRLMSMGFLVPEEKPLIWRGPMVHGALTQFLTQVEWGDLDYLIIDMPPGTGDAQLTISQSAPLTGAIIVTTPQEVSLVDARKGLAMFRDVKVPILGIVENMAGFICPHCEEVTHVFRKGGGEAMAQAMGAPLLASLPLDPRVAEGGDAGTPVVSAFPDSGVAGLYRKMVETLTAQLAANPQAFQPLSLEWQ